MKHHSKVLSIVFIAIAMFGLPGRALAEFDDDLVNFRADVYASPRKALDVLKSEIVNALRAVKTLDDVIVAGDLDDAIINAVKQEFPEAKVKAAPADEKIEPGRCVIRIALSNVQRPGAVWGSRDLESGTLSATILRGTSAKPILISIKFVDKPWADDWTAFVNRDAKRKWVRAESPRPCVSEREADEQARRDAATKLWPAVREQMAINAQNKTKILVTQEFVVAQIEASLARDIGIVDQFVQKFDRPYGRVWKKSLLVDASKQTIDKLALNISRFARAERAEKVGTWGSTGALVAIIILLYFFVNAVTKGYFVWRLRAAALLMGIIGIITVLALR